MIILAPPGKIFWLLREKSTIGPKWKNASDAHDYENNHVGRLG